MEDAPIVKTQQGTETTYFNEVLNKRIRPKITIDDLEMKDKKEQKEPKKEPGLKKYSFAAFTATAPIIFFPQCFWAIIFLSESFSVLILSLYSLQHFFQ